MLDDEIVRRAALQSGAQIVQPLVSKGGVYRIQDGDLVVRDHVGVVGHPVGDMELSLEQVDAVVVYADVVDIVGEVHQSIPRFCLSFFLSYHNCRRLSMIFCNSSKKSFCRSSVQFVYFLR